MTVESLSAADADARFRRNLVRHNLASRKVGSGRLRVDDRRIRRPRQPGGGATVVSVPGVEDADRFVFVIGWDSCDARKAFPSSVSIQRVLSSSCGLSERRHRYIPSASIHTNGISVRNLLQ